MHARVVDFPEPVTPVTSTRPRCSCATLRSTGGNRSSSNVGMRIGMMRRMMTVWRRCRKTLTRNRATPVIWCDVSIGKPASNSSFWLPRNSW